MTNGVVIRELVRVASLESALAHPRIVYYDLHTHAHTRPFMVLLTQGSSVFSNMSAYSVAMFAMKPDTL